MMRSSLMPIPTAPKVSMCLGPDDRATKLFAPIAFYRSFGNSSFAILSVTFSRARAMNDEGFTFRKLCQQLGISHQVIPSPFASQ